MNKNKIKKIHIQDLSFDGDIADKLNISEDGEIIEIISPYEYKIKTTSGHIVLIDDVDIVFDEARSLSRKRKKAIDDLFE